MDWSNCQVHNVLNSDVNHIQNFQEISERESENFQEFQTLSQRQRELDSSVKSLSYLSKVSSLKEFMTKNSWTYCPRCFSLSRQQMLNNYATKSYNLVTDCPCTGDRYSVPLREDFPDNLSINIQDALRLFYVQTNSGPPQRHGYKQRKGPVKLVVATPLPEERIELLEDNERETARQCYNALLNNRHYDTYLNKVLEMLASDQRQIPYYSAFRLPYVEIAIWPCLYLKDEWCESAIKGNETRLSMKRAFHYKAMSSIVDFSNDFDLLQFQYDRYVFKSVTGAIESGKKFQCSPLRSLEGKTFTASYWRWQHLYLKDAVRQFGFPSLFITISPGEWSFPKPQWFAQRQQYAGVDPKAIPYQLSVHIMHILEQIARGYISGVNTQRWRTHACADRRSPGNNNVQAFFYRFEFQKRGTPHVHMLLWLKSMKNLDPNRFSASLPANVVLASHVEKYQSGGKENKSIRPRPEVTSFEKSTIKFNYTEDDDRAFRRAYIDTVLSSLECHMDVQCADGKDLLLQYSTSYVAKMKDHDLLYDTIMKDVSGYDVGNKYMATLDVNVPEMVMQFADIKGAYVNGITKKFRVPFPDQFVENNSVQGYISRPADEENETMPQFLRARNESLAKYKRKCLVLLGSKTCSYFNPVYPFHHSVCNVPFRSVDDLLLPANTELPEYLRYFASALAINTEFWSSDQAIIDHLLREGNREHFANTVLLYIVSQRTCLDFHRNGRFDRFRLANAGDQIVYNVNTMSTSQRYLYLCTVEVLNALVADVVDNPDAQPQPAPVVIDARGRRFLVRGEAGSGKSFILKAIVQYCLDNELSACIACPTGKLAATYATAFPTVRCDTVHSIFSIPVNSESGPSVNWSLTRFHVILVDEVTQIPPEYVRHITLTRDSMPNSPLLVLAGDSCQLRPLATVDGMTRVTQSVFEQAETRTHFREFTMSTQFRAEDEYGKFLDHFRTSIPDQAHIDTLNACRVSNVFPESITAEVVQAHLRATPETTFLVLSRNVEQRLNRLCTNFFFPDAIPFVFKDDNLDDLEIYIGMPVYITENKCKTTRYVNGTCGTVQSITGVTIFIESSGSIVPVFPGISNGVRYYPLKPAYATTVHKIQGQTLKHVTVVFDMPRITSAVGYVAISRVKNLNCFMTMFLLKKAHFVPNCLTD